MHVGWQVHCPWPTCLLSLSLGDDHNSEKWGKQTDQRVSDYLGPVEFAIYFWSKIALPTNKEVMCLFLLWELTISCFQKVCSNLGLTKCSQQYLVLIDIYPSDKSEISLIVQKCLNVKYEKSQSELQELLMEREAWHAAVNGISKSRTQLSNWIELMNKVEIPFLYSFSDHIYFYLYLLYT